MVYRSLSNQDEGDIESGTRVCRECKIRQPMSRFSYANKELGYRRRLCLGCIAKERLSVPNTKRHIRRRYGITLDTYEQLLSDQQNKCAIYYSYGFVNRAPHYANPTQHTHIISK